MFIFLYTGTTSPWTNAGEIHSSFSGGRAVLPPVFRITPLLPLLGSTVMPCDCFGAQADKASNSAEKQVRMIDLYGMIPGFYGFPSLSVLRITMLLPL